MNKKLLLAAFLLILLGIVLRVYQFNKVPVSLYIDEVAMYIDAASIVKSGTDIHGLPWYQTIFPSYGDYKQPLFIWSIALLMKLFGIHEWVVRFPSLITGVLTIVFSSALAFELVRAKNILKKWVAVSTAVVISLSPWAVMFSRTGFEGQLGQFFLVASLYFFQVSTKKYKYILFAIILAALSTYSYFSVRFVFPTLLFAFWMYNLDGKFAFNKKLLKNAVLYFIIPLFSYFLLLVPLQQSPYYKVASDFRYTTDSILFTDDYILQSNELREITGNSPLDRLVFHRYIILMRELIRNYSDHLDFNFLFMSGDQNLRHGTSSDGVFIFGFLPFLVFGLFGLFTSQRKLFFLLVFWWLIALLPASIPETTPHTLRSLNAYAAVSMIIGYGIWYFFRLISEQKKGGGIIVLSSTLILIFIFSLSHFIHYYFVIYPTQSREAWYQRLKVEAQAITQIKGEKKVYIVDDNDKYFLWLIAYSDLLGSSFQEYGDQAFLLQKTAAYENGVHFDDLPAREFIAVTQDEEVKAEIENRFGERIKQHQIIYDGVGYPTHIYDLD